MKMSKIDTFKKIWKFVWDDNSVWSWIVNIILAFVLIKYIIYPLLGLLLGTHYPLVAVVSGSMEHDITFDEFWLQQKPIYSDFNISKEMFEKFPFKNGFKKGDIMMLKGKKAKDIHVGEVIVFQSSKKYPIIHRVVKKWTENGKIFFQTKGDHNLRSINEPGLNEEHIPSDEVLGVALLKIPWIGNLKIKLFELMGLE